MRVAFQGTHGANSEAAARRCWPDLEPVPCREVADVVAAVREGRADAGCLPIENSLIGSVTATFDLLHEAFGDGALKLTREILHPVHHALLGVPGATLAGITRVLSHPVALGQCRTYLERTLPNAQLVGAWDTAGSAEIVAQQGNPAEAAIASKLVAAKLGLAILAENIEDERSNQTRFMVLQRAEDAPTPREGAVLKTSLIICVDHRPGTLVHCLQSFAARGVNLAALQSRPEPASPWTYRFYVDVDGAAHDPRVAEALAEVEALAARLIILGSYEAWAADGSPAPAKAHPTPAHYVRKPEIPLVDRRRHPEGTTVAVRHLVFGGPTPILIGGPCSVESREMILASARAVAEAGGDMLRGGAFKPRTSPYDFQGLGVHALRYLAEAREETGLPIVTEVLSWEEVPLVARFVDMLQIGARNMQNFTLLRAAARSGMPIMLKRGAGATVDEWFMAAEYILAEGNPHVVFCERGIRTFERATRHTLDLNAVALLRERTHLPVIVDPSHAAGVRSLVTPLAMASLAAGAAGLLVEMHPDPDKALSDGAQSLDIAGFTALAKQVHPGVLV